jgi:glyoxylase-like metal-dependent hydrolase (beta-lactamase superfamily II)
MRFTVTRKPSLSSHLSAARPEREAVGDVHYRFVLIPLQGRVWRRNELGREIKIILISHAHDDHAAGCALAKKLTGAKLMVMVGDVEEIEAGGSGDFHYHQHWAPAKVNRILRDGDDVTLGGMRLIAHLTPGHTKGCEDLLTIRSLAT